MLQQFTCRNATWTPEYKSTLVQAMAWCRQATSRCLSQCWHTSISPRGITRPQWLNPIFQGRMFHLHLGMPVEQPWMMRVNSTYTKPQRSKTKVNHTDWMDVRDYVLTIWILHGQKKSYGVEFTPIKYICTLTLENWTKWSILCRFPISFSFIKTMGLWFKFHYRSVPMGPLTMSNHWFR